MAADVSSLVRLMNGGDVKESAESTAPITRDLLGGCFTSQELDLDLPVPCGWEKRLDLKSGKVYIQQSDSTNSSSTSENKPQSSKSNAAKFQDLNFPPASKPTLNLFNDSSLDLQLASLSSASPSSSNYQSVCTLDKVKSALARAEKESGRKRSRSLSNSSSSTKDDDLEVELELQREDKSSVPLAAGCPGCLMYVLISKSNPKCPRCNGNVPLPVAAAAAKKPRIDLNISI